jgi:hypothetical protein
MGRINLITGTASGKIGQLQYQTHGLKCVVRTRQPQGLTNDQAELINKPILLDLSASYHQWAKYLLSEYPSDWERPQALWNYYTKCNRPIFDGTADYEAGFAVSFHGAGKQYRATYTLDPGTLTAEFKFDENPIALPASTVVCLVHGLTSGPPGQWEIAQFPVSGGPQAAPYWDELAGSENIGFFLLDRDGKLYGGMTLCAVQGTEPPEYFSPSPAEVAANMLIYEELDILSEPMKIRFAFNAAFMPSWLAGKTIRYTAHAALEGHPAGTSWTAPYSPAAEFRLQRHEAQSPLDPLLTWVVMDGNIEKSDQLTLKVTNLVIPPGFFQGANLIVYQEEMYANQWYAMFTGSFSNPASDAFALQVYVKFTGQGAVAARMAENPMCYVLEDFPYLWEHSPYIPVTAPCGTAQFIIGDHPDDSRYYIGPAFTVGYEENL